MCLLPARAPSARPVRAIRPSSNESRSSLRCYTRLPVARFIDLVEAGRLLAEVERLIGSVIASKQEYEEADSQLNRIAQRIALSGGMIPPRDEAELLRRRKG